jgi:hypothetical protein
MLGEDLKTFPVVAALAAVHPDAVVGGKSDRGELTLEIPPASIEGVCAYLKNEQKFTRLSTITAVDWYPQEPRFEVVYHPFAERNERLRLKCRLPGEKSRDRFRHRGGAAPTGMSARHSTWYQFRNHLTCASCFRKIGKAIRCARIIL